MKPLRLGVIGTGSVVREIYQHLYFRSRYADGLQVVAACDVQTDSLNWFCDTYDISKDARYTNYEALLARDDLDAIAVNTPDSLHREPVVAAMKAGYDVIVPKPIASTVADAFEMVAVSEQTGRFLGVDFHKRGDPVVREAKARYMRNEYGTLQLGTFFMVDKLLVSDPNHDPRFFASADFAEKNSPVTFLTSHMTDTILTITGLYPVSVTATGYKQKLRSLTPISINGFDTVSTTLVLENGASMNIISGWVLPNTATCITVQSGKMLFTDGMLELWNEWYGFRETTAEGITNRNVLFMNFAEEYDVSGYGVSYPGSILERIGAFQRGEKAGIDAVLTARSPIESGLMTALACEGALVSLDAGKEDSNGVVQGSQIDVRELLETRIGVENARKIYDKHR